LQYIYIFNGEIKMKLGNKSILATTIAAAMFSGAALASSELAVVGANAGNTWSVSTEKAAALSGDYTFETTSLTAPTAGSGEALLTYVNDIDLNDGDKLTFNFGNTALLKSSDYVLVAVSNATGGTLVLGEVYGNRISDVDTVNGVSSIRLRIANAGATGITKGTTLALVEADSATGNQFGDLTLSAPTGSWTSSACVNVTATDVSGDDLPGAYASQKCVLDFADQFSLFSGSLTDLTAEIDVETERKTYVAQTTIPTSDGEEAVAVDTTGTLSRASYGVSNNVGALDDFITLDSNDTVTFTFTDSSDWNGVDFTNTTFDSSLTSAVTGEDDQRTYSTDGATFDSDFDTALEFVYDVYGTTGTTTLTPHTVKVSASIDFDEANFADVSIDEATLYNVGINGSTSKVATFILNPSEADYASWIYVANESADTAEVEVDVVMDGMTYTGVKLAAVAGETVSTYGHAAIGDALEAQKGVTIAANAKVTLTVVVTAKEDKVHVSGQNKDSKSRTKLDVYYKDMDVSRTWRN
jgi:hypothetical protein